MDAKNKRALFRLRSTTRFERGRYFPGRYATQTARRWTREPFTSGLRAGINARRVLHGGTPRSALGRTMFGGYGRSGILASLFKAGGNVGKALTKKKFMIPFLVGAAVIGTTKGINRKMLESEQGYAVLQSNIPRWDSSGNAPYGLPLGYPEPEYQYTLPRDNTLGATGMLALAAFKTRHGR